MIRDAIDSGANSVKKIGKATGAGTDCARCQRHIKILLDEQRNGPGANDEELQ